MHPRSCVTTAKPSLAPRDDLLPRDLTSCLSSPALLRRQWRVVGWVDILLDMIGGVEVAVRGGCPRTMTGVSQHWFWGHFRQVFFNTIASPRINIVANMWGE
jgi:hypothetical protein